MATYRLTFDFETTADPYEWFWPGLLDEVNRDDTQIDYSTVTLKEIK